VDNRPPSRGSLRPCPVYRASPHVLRRAAHDGRHLGLCRSRSASRGSTGSGPAGRSCASEIAGGGSRASGLARWARKGCAFRAPGGAAPPAASERVEKSSAGDPSPGKEREAYSVRPAVSTDESGRTAALSMCSQPRARDRRCPSHAVGVENLAVSNHDEERSMRRKPDRAPEPRKLDWSGLERGLATQEAGHEGNLEVR